MTSHTQSRLSYSISFLKTLSISFLVLLFTFLTLFSGRSHPPALISILMPIIQTGHINLVFSPSFLFVFLLSPLSFSPSFSISSLLPPISSTQFLPSHIHFSFSSFSFSSFSLLFLLSLLPSFLPSELILLNRKFIFPHTSYSTAFSRKDSLTSTHLGSFLWYLFYSISNWCSNLANRYSLLFQDCIPSV